MSAATQLLELAEEVDGEVVPGWGRVEVRLPANVDLGKAQAAISASGAHAVGLLGLMETELDLSADPPVQSELDQAAAFAASVEVERQVRASASAWNAVELLIEQLQAIRVTYTRANWCMTAAVFQELVNSEWMTVADGLCAGVVQIGEREVVLEAAVGGEHAVLVPTGDVDPEEVELVAIVDELQSLADATAWRNIAVGEERSGTGLAVYLHGDHRSPVVLTPPEACGGAELFAWLHATDDANRNEALRHVLRFLTATSNVLPDAQTAQTLAERQRIALARENAAEVHRAISEGRAETVAGLDSSRTRFSALVEETSKTLQATVVASIGIVALVARNDGLLPDWLLVLVSIVATASVVGLLISRWRQLGETADGIRQLRATLDDDPLLPGADRRALQERVVEFGGDRRRREARAGIVAYAAMAVVVVWAATGWLLADSSDDRNARPVVALDGFVRSADGLTELCDAHAIGDICGGHRYVVVGIEDDIAGLDLDVETGWSSERVLVTGLLSEGLLESAVLRE